LGYKQCFAVFDLIRIDLQAEIFSENSNFCRMNEIFHLFLSLAGTPHKSLGVGIFNFNYSASENS